MRVAIVTESFPPDVNGVSNSVSRIAEYLSARGHHLLVVAPRPRRRTFVDTELGYPVVRFALGGGSLTSTTRRS